MDKYLRQIRVQAQAVANHLHEMDNRGQAASNLTGLIVGIAVAAIVGVGVGIPIVNQVTAEANLTGVTATVVGFIPVMLGLLIFVATASPIMRRT